MYGKKEMREPPGETKGRENTRGVPGCPSKCLVLLDLLCCCPHESVLNFLVQNEKQKWKYAERETEEEEEKWLLPILHVCLMKKNGSALVTCSNFRDEMKNHICSPRVSKEEENSSSHLHSKFPIKTRSLEIMLVTTGGLQQGDEEKRCFGDLQQFQRWDEEPYMLTTGFRGRKEQLFSPSVTQ